MMIALLYERVLYLNGEIDKFAFEELHILEE